MSVHSLRILLIPFSFLYGLGVVIRNWLFDIGLFGMRRIAVPVVSVGNISTGGVGKTPFVELLARRFSQRGHKVAIVSRGYKRKGSGTVVVSNGRTICAEADVAGDEPAQLAAKLTDVVVIVDERRARGAQYAVEKFKSSLVLLDDGFQHRSLHRDLDIAVVSVDEVFEPAWLLPAGNCREPRRSLLRADLVVISRCDDVTEFDRAKERVERWVDKPIIGVGTRVNAVRRAKSNFSIDLGGLNGKSVVAFSGIGDPRSFERVLGSLKLNIKRHLAFPDHHRFSEQDVSKVLGTFRQEGAEYLLTTEKDVARLGGMRETANDLFENNPVFYVEIEQVVLSGEEVLQQRLQRFEHRKLSNVEGNYSP